MRSRTSITLLLSIIVVGIGVFLFSRAGDGTVKITISQGMIDAALARSFPKEKTYLRVVRVTYQNPRATFLPDQDKVLVSLEVMVRMGITGLEKTYTGSASITTKIGYNPLNYRFYLQEPELVTIEVPKIPDNYRQTLREGLNLIASEFAGAIPVYKLTREDTKTQLAKLLLKNVEIRENKAVLTLGL